MNPIFILSLIGLVIVAFASIIHLFPYDSSKDNKIRPLGLVCDVCKGKYDQNGNLLIRCHIKSTFLKLVGLYDQSNKEQLVEPVSYDHYLIPLLIASLLMFAGIAASVAGV